MYKVVLLCGGRGIRLSEETNLIPKPMIKIGEYPLIMHIINFYESFNFKDFILCLGYKQEIIRDYFLNYHLHNSNIKINLETGDIFTYKKSIKDIDVSLIDTGEDSLTGSRLIQIKDYIDDDVFLMTYADGLSNVNINELIKFHKSHGKIATLTAVKKKGKFGTIELQNNLITSFKEKPIDDDYINGGFFCFSKKIFDYLVDGDLPDTLELLAKDNQLMAYKFKGFWDCVDNINDKIRIENLWSKGDAAWKI